MNPARRRRSGPTAMPPGSGGATLALRAAVWLVFAFWGLRLMAADLRSGAIVESFLHLPLLVFHEAGHVLMRPFGDWMTIAGGSLMQCLMPAVMAVALWRHRDHFGAWLAVWLAGVSVLDVAAYAYDALEPQLMLLTGTTGADGPHDWIWLLDESGHRADAQRYGRRLHRLGSLLIVGALAGAAHALWRQWRHPEDEAPPDDER